MASYSLNALRSSASVGAAPDSGHCILIARLRKFRAPPCTQRARAQHKSAIKERETRARTRTSRGDSCGPRRCWRWPTRAGRGGDGGTRVGAEARRPPEFRPALDRVFGFIGEDRPVATRAERSGQT